MLLMLCIVAGPFGIGLGASSLLGGGLRIGGNCFGVDAALRFVACASLRGGFTAGSRTAFGFGAFFVDMLHGDFTGVFRGLYDFARLGNQGFLVSVLPGGERIGFVHLANGLFVAWGGVSFGAGRLRDAQGIAGFKEFERQFGVQNNRVEPVARGDVAPAIDQFILGVHSFASADGIRANGVLEDHDVAGTTH